MRSDSHYPNKQDFRDDLVYDSPLLIEPRGAEASPLTRQRLIAKALDCTKALWTRKPRNVLPFFVAFQYFYRNAPRGKLFIDFPVLFDTPHTIL